MKTKDLFLTASSNLLRSKVRTLLTILAIFIGAFTLTLTSAMGAGVSSYVDNQLGNLGQDNSIFITAKTESGSPGQPQKYNEDEITAANPSDPGRPATVLLTSKDLEKLKKYANIEEVSPLVIANPDYIEGQNGEKYKILFSQIPSGTQLDLITGEQVSSNRREIIIPESYVKTLGYENNDVIIGEEISIAISDVNRKQYVVKAKVTGVLAKGLIGSSGAVVSDLLLDELYKHQITGLPEAASQVYVAFVAKIKGENSDVNVDKIKSDLKEMNYEATTVKDQLGIIDTVIKAITYVLNFFALIALLAAAFGIVNTLLMSVQERTKEIGLMKAMGMSPKRIFALFSLEAILIGFWGSAAGVVGAMGLGFTLNNVLQNGILKDLPGFNLFIFPPNIILFTMGLIMLIGFLAGALPARRAAKLNPIDALRYE